MTSKRLEYIPFISRPSYTLTRMNNLRIILGSKPEKFKTIEARKKVMYFYNKCVSPSSTKSVEHEGIHVFFHNKIIILPELQFS